MKPPARPQLLGFWMCTALVVGNTIGSGVFLLPVALAPLGLNSVLGWGFTTCGAILLAFVFARLSRAFPQAGGPYAYVKLAFGPFTAFIVAWGYWVSIWAVLLLVSPQTLASSNAPFVDLATQYWGDTAGKVLAVFAAVSGFGALNGWILLQGALPNVMAKNGEFPRIFAKDSPRLTPTFALIFSSGLVSILILLNYQKSMAKVFDFMILLSTAACLVLYLMCAVALLRLISIGRMPAPRGRVASLAVLGVIATLYCLWAIVGAGEEIVAWGAGLLLLGAPAYFMVRSKAELPA
jgi:amino acid transporter